VTVSLLNAAAQSGGDAAGDTIGGFEALRGGGGRDNLLGDSLANILDGGGDNDVLTGGSGPDTLVGGAGSDLLAGGFGADRMIGGADNDTYVVDNAGDVVVEAANEGIDTIRSLRAAQVLAAHVEHLVAANGIAHAFTGNGLANAITGSIGADTLIGLVGADTLNGGAGADRLVGGADNDTYVVDNAGDVVVEVAGQGIDVVRTTLAALTLAVDADNLIGLLATGQALTGNELGNAITGGGGADALAGGAGADTLNGGAGADTLDGGSEVDRLSGSLGDDRYVVTLGDLVFEGLNQGRDTMVAVDGTSRTLAANVEVLVLQGATLVTGVGNGLANEILGNAGGNLLSGLGEADVLRGEGGADTLVGGLGRDTMFGGAAADRFRFVAPGESTTAAPDRVADFVFGEGDRIELVFMDANATPADGNQPFAFIGTAAFGGLGAASAGQLRNAGLVSAGVYRVQGDVDGNGTADLAIDVASAAAPVAGWFIL
jgi:Ca2+-binding RTX toxin-like protein